ncbi:hypothetical protein ACE38W_00795 [Chitinophaga sp. Hz27]|uniref:hypothetical protein n=1 Tax=Chitinophaga sp. Hz27 TaxID=3347169 RepID=UPI0035DC13AB
MNKLTLTHKDKKNIFAINPKNEPLTPDKLRELTSIEINDEKATEIIHSIRLFCKLLYDFSVNRNKELNIDSQLINETQYHDQQNKAA